jgi:hypothetical protein
MLINTRMQGMQGMQGFRVSGFGFRVSGLGFRVQTLGMEDMEGKQGLKFRV